MSTPSLPITVTNWFEVYSSNVESAINFYAQVFGWTKESMPMGPEDKYWMLKAGEASFAGVMDLNHPNLEGVPPHWGTYLHTDDCAATVVKVTELGGKVVYGPMAIPGVGTVAGLNDPFGAHFNIHQPEGERTEPPQRPVNWIEHMGPNREGALEFYKALFGWGSMDMDMGEPIGTYSMFLVGDYPVGGCMTVGGGEMPPNWMIYLHADNIEAACEKVTAAGGKVLSPVMDIGDFGHIAMVSDCCGAVFGLHQPSAAHS